MEIVKEMFFQAETPIKTKEDFDLIVNKCPILIHIYRRVDTNSGEFVRTIHVYSRIYARVRDDLGNAKEMEGSMIGDSLICDDNDPAPDTKTHMRNCLSKSFNTLKEAERWVDMKINEIRKTREKIMKNKTIEKPSEYIVEQS